MQDDILDEINELTTSPPQTKLFTILSTINACLSIMLSMSLLLIVYNKVLGLPSSEIAFIYIYVIFFVLCFTGFIFTVLSFVKKESPKTLMWIVGIINSMFFLIFLFGAIYILSGAFS